ncbi:calcium uptake protein 3, mitochondrial-like isoform X2 [Anneissia japonica]|uniref:calcium uptake protein 3, mitochondrial-like isoform X2 n=1 Tax=Anneissia japonica TaxID=1529436 RepID=UPI001425B156|nr:calcium uptake protein 3, mitochondrial-like isoform X2 [Anneissia japonica]
MTMQDFLESITEENPRPRIGRFKLRREEVSNMLTNTPPKTKGSKNFFRSLLGRGIISYTEYLFLLCILTKPKAGFEVAFKMFDRDGNQRVDKKEFLLMEEIFRMKSERSADESCDLSKKNTKSKSCTTSSLMIQNLKSKKQDFVVQETTLLRYFFGSKGRETLDFNTFCQFMDNLQTEVLELEFMEFAKGMPTISEADFAQVLLRYTQIDEDEKLSYFTRVREKILHQKGISFDEFRNFFQFLNNLDDFEIVMKMYTFADQSISQAEFERAVQVTTGHQLAPHLVDTVFQIFDKDGDGKLSQKEFIGVMKNRIHRGFREHLKSPVGWSGFKACVKHEIKYSL